MTIALNHLLAMPWAMTAPALGTMMEIAAREHEFAGRLDALESKLGRPLDNTRVTSVRDGIAVIPIAGPLFKRASMFQAISGAVDYTAIAGDLTTALENPGVSAVMLAVDSPGGQVEGLADLAAMIHAAKKPVWAHVDGTMASAAYWLGSAADRVIASDTAVIGSVGVVMAMRTADAKAGEKNYRFVSSQSPMKAADPATNEGAAAIQAVVDDLGQVFIDTVARHRSISAADAASNFGRGDVMVAAKAKASGMIDAVMPFEAAFAELKKEIHSMDYKDLTTASLGENRPDLVAGIRAEALAGVETVDAAAIQAAAITAERERITAIEALAMPGAESVIKACKEDGSTAADAAMKVVKYMQTAQAQSGAAALGNIKKAEADMTPPTPGNDNTAAQTDEQKAQATMQSLRTAGVIR